MKSQLLVYEFRVFLNTFYKQSSHSGSNNDFGMNDAIIEGQIKMTFSQQAPVKKLSINCCIEMFYEKFKITLKLVIIDEILRHCSVFLTNCEQKMMTLGFRTCLWFVFVCRDSVTSTAIHDGTTSQWENKRFKQITRFRSCLENKHSWDYSKDIHDFCRGYQLGRSKVCFSFSFLEVKNRLKVTCGSTFSLPILLCTFHLWTCVSVTIRNTHILQIIFTFLRWTCFEPVPIWTLRNEYSADSNVFLSLQIL